MLLAEASKCRGPTDIINVLGQAESALREAEWILDEREVDLRRQPPNETATTSVRTDRGRARMVLGNIALARVRLTDMDNVEAVKMLRTTEEVMRGSDLDAETAVVRGEVIEAIAERLECTERKECLLEAGRMYRMGIGTDRRIEVFSLLGDVCLALARGGTDAAVGEGVQAYETAVKEGDLAVETLYNMACLLAIGVGQRASEDAERRIGALLKQGVNAGGVSLAELRQDEDLRNVRQKEWFQKLLQYTERRNSKQ